MASQTLDKILGVIPTLGNMGLYRTIDVYTGELVVLYTPKPKDLIPSDTSIGQIPSLPSSPINPVVIPYGNLTGLGGDVHDTFKIDRYDNIYGGHTSIKIPGYGPIRIPWENE